MCLEDIAIGRKTKWEQRLISVAAADSAFLPEEWDRAIVIINAPSAGTLTISLAAIAVVNEGLTLAAGAVPLILRSTGEFGVCERPMRAIMSAGTVNIAVWIGRFYSDNLPLLPNKP